MSATYPTVYLVGAGPGDPGLLTVAGERALRRAAVCVYDYLANPALLDLLPPGCARIYVGKAAGAHTLTQDEINALLIEKARAGAADAVIVRLKGGDPYVFGRGGEEAAALQAVGIRFVVIPGVTAGIAGPAYAGIPVTQRGVATSVTFVTGHESAEKDPDALTIDFAGLASLIRRGGTVVFYMGVRNLDQIAAKLREHGAAATVPCAVIAWATYARQRTVTGTLETIGSIVREAAIAPPAITVVGHVVELRETLNFFEQRPLHGKMALVTRTRRQASELATRLTALGATVLEAPTIDIAEPTDWTPVDVALHELPSYAWVIFTSANAVEATWQRLTLQGRDSRSLGSAKVAAIGPGTAAALRERGVIADLVPATSIGEALADAVLTAAGDLSGKRVLWLRADGARPALQAALTAAGALVDDLTVYRTVAAEALPGNVLAALEKGAVDWITFTSASTAKNLHALLPAEMQERVAAMKLLSIGPITSAAMRELGWKPSVEATEHNIDGMIAALLRDAV
jgi:uroporphyrinogen III methyltransferase/synthase